MASLGLLSPGLPLLSSTPPRCAVGPKAHPHAARAGAAAQVSRWPLAPQDLRGAIKPKHDLSGTGKGIHTLGWLKSGERCTVGQDAICIECLGRVPAPDSTGLQSGGLGFGSGGRPVDLVESLSWASGEGDSSRKLKRFRLPLDSELNHLIQIPTSFT